MKNLSTLICFLFISQPLFPQYYKDYKSILSAGQEEEKIYALLKEVILSSEKDTSVIHFFPLYYTAEKNGEYIFRSFIYAEPIESPYSKKLESATYYVSLTLPIGRKTNYDKSKLIGFQDDKQSQFEENKNEVWVFSPKDQELKLGSKPIFKKDVDSLFLNNKFNLEEIVYKKNVTSNLVDSSFYKKYYNPIRFISKEYLITINKDNFYGIIAPNGKIILPFEYLSIEPYQQGILVKKENAAYFIDINGKRISEEYENISPLSEYSRNYKNLLRAKRNDKVTILSSEFKELLPFYDDIQLFSADYKQDDRLIIKNQGKMFLFNPNLWKETTTQYDKISPLDKFLYITENQNRTGLIDNNGKEILENKYDSILLSESYIGNEANRRILYIKKNQKFAIFKNNKLLTDFEFDSIEDFLFGKLFIVSKKGKYGIINQNAEIFVPMKYKSKDFINEPEIKDLLNAEIEKYNNGR